MDCSPIHSLIRSALGKGRWRVGPVPAYAQRSSHGLSSAVSYSKTYRRRFNTPEPQFYPLLKLVPKSNLLVEHFGIPSVKDTFKRKRLLAWHVMNSGYIIRILLPIEPPTTPAPAGWHPIFSSSLVLRVSLNWETRGTDTRDLCHSGWATWGQRLN